jgi:glyoxalase family protein
VERRLGQNVLVLEDPDGMRLELVETDDLPKINFWADGPIPQEYALHGFHSVTLWLEEMQSTGELLTSQMGYQAAGQEENRHRFTAESNALGHTIDLVEDPEKPRARLGVGSIHHIAFRVPNDQQQLEYQKLIRNTRFNVTDVLDRSYFHSIYFREHGGVLFEIATDTPGFATDEPVDALGETLRLPEWFEPNRTAIEESLMPIELKSVEKVS